MRTLSTQHRRIMKIHLLQLFLLHMDEILPNVVDNNNSIDAPIGCSTIIVNEPGNVSFICCFRRNQFIEPFFDRKHSDTRKMHCRRISTTFTSFRRTSFLMSPKGSTKLRKSALLRSATLATCPATP